MVFLRFILLALLPLILVAGSSKDWKPATVADIKTDSYSRVSGYNGTVVSARRKVWTYSLDDGERVYDAERDGRNALLGVEVNGRIEISIEKNHVYMRLPDGRELKLTLVKTTRKVPAEKP